MVSMGANQLVDHHQACCANNILRIHMEHMAAKLYPSLFLALEHLVICTGPCS